MGIVIWLRFQIRSWGSAWFVSAHLFGRVCPRHQLVELPLVRLSSNLADSREEGLGVVEARDPRHLGDLHGVALPLVELVEAEVEVGQPRGEGAEARPGALPLPRSLIKGKSLLKV